MILELSVRMPLQYRHGMKYLEQVAYARLYNKEDYDRSKVFHYCEQVINISYYLN